MCFSELGYIYTPDKKKHAVQVSLEWISNYTSCFSSRPPFVCKLLRREKKFDNVAQEVDLPLWNLGEGGEDPLDYGFR